MLAVSAARQFRETNKTPNPGAVRLRGLAGAYLMIAGTAGFWAYALPGALSYASIFVFISGSSFVLIRILDVPTEYYGYCFAFGVSGYLAGTILCRRLLVRLGMERTLDMGSRISLAAGLLFLGLVASGQVHWWVVLACQFLTMCAHGINFPCSQAGAVAPFPGQAGAAAGLLGFFTMLAALLAGTLVGASHDGTLLPLAAISLATNSSLFVGVHLLRPQRAAAC